MHCIVNMELLASSGVHRGSTASCPVPSMLAISRRLGRATLTGLPMPLPRLQQREGAGSNRKIFTSWFLNPVKLSQRVAKGTWARVSSHQSNSYESVDTKGKDAALSYLNIAHKQRRQEAVGPQAVQATTASPGTPSNPKPLSSVAVIPPELLQGTKEWLDLRKNRMTASSFGNSLGFWGGRRVEVWEEKIGVREPFAGNAATVWGSSEEAAAIEKYKTITGNSVSHTAFKIYQDGDDHLSWLGASPDGLIRYSGQGEENTVEKLGILEVKCPYNKGKPELGTPWDAVPHYYMPQAQGLLEIFDREEMDFYVWTMNGSSVFRIQRNREYWGVMFRMMAEFWWGHVVPAKSALEKGKSVVDVQAFRPVEDLVATERIIRMSRHLAQNSRLVLKEKSGQIQQF